MATVRTFNGSNARIAMDPGAGGGAFGTYLAIIKPTTVTPSVPLCVFALRKDSSTSNQSFLGVKNTTGAVAFYPGGDSNASVVCAANAWQLIAMTKATGTSTPRLHRWSFSAWQHGDGPSGSANYQTADFGFWVGFTASSDWFDGSIAMIAMLSGIVLSDAQLESLNSTQGVINLGATQCWEFGQATHTDVVPDLTGGGANSNFEANTTVTTGETISGWTFGVGGASSLRNRLLLGVG